MDSPLLLYCSLAGAFFLVVCLGVGCGMAGAYLRVRSMHVLHLALEDRVSLTEGILQREVKGRAGRERWDKNKPDPLEAQLLEAVAKAPPAKKMNWWDTGLPRSYNGK